MKAWLKAKSAPTSILSKTVQRCLITVITVFQSFSLEIFLANVIRRIQVINIPPIFLIFLLTLKTSWGRHGIWWLIRYFFLRFNNALLDLPTSLSLATLSGSNLMDASALVISSWKIKIMWTTSLCEQRLAFTCSIVALRESLCLNRVRSLLGMRGMLLGYSLESRPNSRVLGTVGSAMTLGLLTNRCSYS